MAAAKDPILYMFPLSFYSQKVRLALRERRVKHTEVLINLSTGDQNKASYLKLNPNGEVPMLQVQTSYFSDSEKLIDMIGQFPPGDGANMKLLPNEDSPEAKEVKAWRAKLDEISCGNLTYGVMLNPDLSIDEQQVPANLRPTKEGLKVRYNDTIKKLEETSEKHPDLKPMCQKKIEVLKRRLVTFYDRSLTLKIMDDIDKLMDDVENQLNKLKTRDALNIWLCGPDFTTADINLCVLLGRLNFLGLAPRYMDQKKRPSLCAYWNAAKERQTVKQVILDNVAEVKAMIIKQKVKKIALVTTCVGLVSAGAWMAYKHFR